jgi:hypothetical protein
MGTPVERSGGPGGISCSCTARCRCGRRWRRWRPRRRWSAPRTGRSRRGSMPSRACTGHRSCRTSSSASRWTRTARSPASIAGTRSATPRGSSSSTPSTTSSMTSSSARHSACHPPPRARCVAHPFVYHNHRLWGLLVLCLIVDSSGCGQQQQQPLLVHEH